MRPFEKLNRRLKVGKITNGRVSSINRFGLVIQLDCGAEGFVYLEELDYDSSVKVEHFNINERVNVLIIGIDPSQERIDLSIKRTQKDPWLEIDRYVTVGRNEEAIVSKILYNGIVIEIRNKIKGILYLSNMRPIIDDTEIKNKFQEGDYVYVTITGINKRKKELKLRQVSL